MKRNTVTNCGLTQGLKDSRTQEEFPINSHRFTHHLLSLAAALGIGLAIATPASALSYTALDLGTLAETTSFAYGINASGQVVGYAQTAGNAYHAFISGANGVGMIDLNSLVTLTAGEYLYEARGINDRGQIVATSDGGRAYLLSPVPAPVPLPQTAALMLSALGLLGFIARRKQRSVG